MRKEDAPRWGDRSTKATPEPILRMLDAPYVWISQRFGDASATLLDIACGQCLQYDAVVSSTRSVRDSWGRIISMDIEEVLPGVTVGDIRAIDLATDSVEAAICSETIEHLCIAEQAPAVAELLRVCRGPVIIGSVDIAGPKVFAGLEVWVAPQANHRHEMDGRAFKQMIERGLAEHRRRGGGKVHVEFWRSEEGEPGEVRIWPGLWEETALSNYAVLRKVPDE